MNRPEPAYLLLGPESGNKSQRIKEIRRLCHELNGGEEAELHRFYPFETENGEILASLQNASLFSPHRLVILAEAENLKAAQAQMIAAYLKNPSDTATLIIVSAQNSVHPSLMKAVPAKQREMFWELFDNQKNDWIRNYFRARGIRITQDAVDLLLSMIENNTQDLKVVCQQLASHLSTMREEQGLQEQIEVTEDEIEQYIYHSKTESVFTLFEKIAARDLEATLDILKALELSREADPIQLFGGMLWQFRRLYSFMSLIDEGESETVAFSKATVLGKAAAIRGKHNQRIYRQASGNFTLVDIQNIISHICTIDAETREMGSTLQPILFERLLHTIICRAGVPVTSEEFLRSLVTL